MKLAKRLFTTALICLPVALFTSCESSDSSVNADSVDLTFSNGVMFPISSGSCADKKSSLTTGVIVNSLAATSLQIPNVTLTWKDTSLILTVYTLKVTITSSAIVGGVYKTTIEQTELEPLFGKPYATIPAAASDTAPTVINSSGSKPGYAACGLSAGSIPLVHPDTQGPFTALITIQFLGSAHNADFTVEKAVRKTFTTSANFN